MLLVRYLHPVDHNPRRITKAVKDFAKKKLDFKDIKFQVKIRDILKIEKKKRILPPLVLLVNENKEKYSIYASKKCSEEKHNDLLSTGEEGKGHFVLIKDFNIFMYDHTLHRGRKHFYRYKLLVQKKYLNFILKITLNLMVNKGLRCPYL